MGVLTQAVKEVTSALSETKLLPQPAVDDRGSSTKALLPRHSQSTVQCYPGYKHLGQKSLAVFDQPAISILSKGRILLTHNLGQLAEVFGEGLEVIGR